MREEGTPFGSYVLLKRLARGGMAEVFLARQRGPEGFDRYVAVKRVLPHLADSDDFVRQFHDEARLAARLGHSNVVHIYEFGKVGDHYFIAMEYVDGVHAGALIQHGAKELVPAALVARIGADACAGLNYAHRLTDAEGRPLRLVHRDISPPNLMISFDGVVKLVDFGIAKAVSSVDKTRPGVVKGKFAYMSPEQTMGKKLDGRSDVFSLGLVCWEILAGRVAVDRTDPVEAMKSIRDGNLPSIRQVRPDVPPGLALVIEQALQQKPQDRPSAAELGNAFEGFIKSSPELGTSMELAEWIRARFGNEPREEHEPEEPDAPRQDAIPPQPAPAEPRFDPKVSFLQDVDDDSPTQVASKPAPPPDQRDLPPLPRAHTPGAAPQQGTMPPQPGAMPPQQGAMPPQQGAMPPQQGAMPPQQGTMPPQPGAMPPQPGAMPPPHYWARFTGMSRVRRRRILLATGGIALFFIIVALAASSDSSDPQMGAAMGVDSGAADAQIDPEAPGDAGAGANEADPANEAKETGEHPVEAGRDSAQLEVITDPDGALIILDDDQIAESPAVFEDLRIGEHTIRVERDGYHSLEQIIELDPGYATVELPLKRTSSRRRARKGRLSIVTRPASTVYIGGKKKLGTTPFANKVLSPGKYTLTFEKAGYKRVKKRVTIRPGETTKLNFKLRER